MLFRYTVKFYTEDPDLYPTASDTGLVVEKGVVGSSSWVAATKELVEWFGKDNLLEISFYELENPLEDEEIKDLMQV